jgi:FkbM family methyltransferase
MKQVQGIHTANANALEVSQNKWLQGDWESLAKHQSDTLETHPDRARLALYAAIGNLQLGHGDTAKQLIENALSWGINKKHLSNLLIASVHNSLGRAAAALGDEVNMERHFSAALVGAEGGATPLARQQRTIKELIRIGFWQDGAKLIERHTNALQPDEQPRKAVQAAVDVLKSEVGILQHELSIALQRQQLNPLNSGVPAITDQASMADSLNVWREQLQQRAVSQLGQDLWVLEKSNFKQGGFFVEFGATDGVLLSNTYLLEKEFGWNGLCAEPNPAFLPALKQNRRCIVSDACIGPTTGESVEFVFADVFGGMLRHATRDMHGARRDAYRLTEGTVTLVTQSLHDFLLEHKAPKTIDYLSIDTEGSEYEILEAFPFEQWSIKLITVEHNYSNQRKHIQELLVKNGYQTIEAQWEDWYFK